VPSGNYNAGNKIIAEGVRGMQELFTVITGASGLIEKGGVIGVLLIFCGILVGEVVRLRKTLVETYRQRDKARFALVKARAALSSAGIQVDFADVSEFLGD